jgi:hypothetical protein
MPLIRPASYADGFLGVARQCLPEPLRCVADDGPQLVGLQRA